MTKNDQKSAFWGTDEHILLSRTNTDFLPQIMGLPMLDQRDVVKTFKSSWLLCLLHTDSSHDEFSSALVCCIGEWVKRPGPREGMWRAVGLSLIVFFTNLPCYNPNS